MYWLDSRGPKTVLRGAGTQGFRVRGAILLSHPGWRFEANRQDVGFRAATHIE
jgi:hypothetical protein